jgi:predicted nucleic acid-binding Zn ribbon protein
MPNCSNCGEFIRPNEVYKREIYVGTTNRVNYGKRITFGNSRHYRKQTVCSDCAKLIDKQNENQSKSAKIILLIVGILIVVFIISLKR